MNSPCRDDGTGLDSPCRDDGTGLDLRWLHCRSHTLTTN